MAAATRTNYYARKGIRAVQSGLQMRVLAMVGLMASALAGPTLMMLDQGELGDAPPPPTQVMAAPPAEQIRMEQTVIIRVPSAPKVKPPKSSKNMQVKYKETSIGKCLAARKIAGAKVSGNSSLDLLTTDGHQVRAYLNKGCEAREFYSGFYIERPKDGLLCVDREILHARSGSQCEIAKFRLLKPR